MLFDISGYPPFQEPQLCRQCHGSGDVKAECACGCGKSQSVTCPRCFGSGKEPMRNKYWLNLEKGARWLASKVSL